MKSDEIPQNILGPEDYFGPVKQNNGFWALCWCQKNENAPVIVRAAPSRLCSWALFWALFSTVVPYEVPAPRASLCTGLHNQVLRCAVLLLQYGELIEHYGPTGQGP